MQSYNVIPTYDLDDFDPQAINLNEIHLPEITPEEVGIMRDEFLRINNITLPLQPTQLSNSLQNSIRSYSFWTPYLKLNGPESYPKNFSFFTFFDKNVKQLLVRLPNCKKNILKAIREQLVSVNFINTFPDSILNILFSNNGLIALREKLISPEQIKMIGVPDKLEELFSNEGIERLRECPMTDDQAQDLCSKFSSFKI